MQGSDGTKGAVNFAREYTNRGLKNKRRTHWAKIRRAKQIKIENAERALAEFENDWDEQYGGGHGQY